MDLAEILILAVGLGMDALSVALAVGAVLGVTTKRQAFRLSFHFGLFQFLMPVVGWVFGNVGARLIQAYDHWVAFGILLAVGLHMIVESFREETRLVGRKDPTRGWSLVGLSLATSIDALGVGVGIGVMDQKLVYPAVVIGLVAGGMTLIGLRMAGTLRNKVGRRLETAGGLILVVLAFKMLSI